MCKQWKDASKLISVTQGCVILSSEWLCNCFRRPHFFFEIFVIQFSFWEGGGGVYENLEKAYILTKKNVCHHFLRCLFMYENMPNFVRFRFFYLFKNMHLKIWTCLEGDIFRYFIDKSRKWKEITCSISQSVKITCNKNVLSYFGCENGTY